MTTIAIIGAGQAGVQAAASLRQSQFNGRIVLINGEGRLPYQRPPLSKMYIKGDVSFERLLLRPEAFYRDNAVQLISDRTATRIDRNLNAVWLNDGSALKYDRVILATGARNRQLDVPGAGFSNVHCLRTATEAELLRATLARAKKVVVIGGGFIGLEVASVLRSLGSDVTILHAGPRLMGRSVSPYTSEFFLHVHRSAGINFAMNDQAVEICGSGRAETVKTVSGEQFECDAVLVAIGIVPNVELAEDCGLTVSDGIVVDENMVTSDPQISAIGDCCAFYSKFASRSLRLDSIQNAVDQAKCVANHVAGPAHAYDSVPWFWSDQGSYKLQMAGITTGDYRTYVARQPEPSRLAVYAFRGDVLVGLETVNMPAEHMAMRKILSIGTVVTKSEMEYSDFVLAQGKASVA